MKHTDRTYTREEVERLRQQNYVVPQTNVVYDEELVSSEGMSFTLIDEAQLLKELEQAEKYLRAQRDVVGPIYLARIVE